MARRQLHPLFGNEVEERVVRRRSDVVHRRHDALIGLRPRDRRDVRERLADRLRFRAHATRHDHAPVLRHRRADRLQRLLLGAVQEAAGVDDDGVSPGMAPGELVALRAQLRQDPLGIHQRLRTAEGNEGNAWRVDEKVGHRVRLARGRGASKAAALVAAVADRGRSATGRVGIKTHSPQRIASAIVARPRPRAPRALPMRSCRAFRNTLPFP